MSAPAQAGAPPPAGRLPAIEAVRGAAALYVLLYHSVHLAGWPRGGALALPFRFGQEAVVAFFLVSGFVIHLSLARAGARGAPPSLGRYALHRFRRIYPILLAALSVTAAVQLAVPGAYALAPFSARDLAGTLLMVQDRALPSPWARPFMGNVPLWSLSYEWIFYFLYYALWRLVPVRWHDRVAAALAWGAVPGVLAGAQAARFALPFLVWYAGAAEARRWLDPADAAAARAADRCLVHVALLALLFAALAAGSGGPPRQTGLVTPWRELRHFLAATLMLAACRAGLAAALWRRLSQSGAGRAAAALAIRAGGVSYALYALHFPLVVRTAPAYAFLPAPFGWAVAVAACLVLSWLLERRVQPAIERVLR